MFRKLYEMGYSPIPVYLAGKNPKVSNWQKYCEERATENEIDYWDTQKINIGIACGKASNIVVLDIDTDDQDVLKSLPLSPVRRRGRVGEARFFRYNPSIASTSFPGLDILSDGRQIIVPPSIHPDTQKPYFWLTKDTLENTPPEDLPEITVEDIAKILPHFKTKTIEGTGRNNKLKDMVSAMRARGEPEQKIIKEIYEWDSMYHTPRLFTDRKEAFAAANEQEAMNNAWLFVTNVTKTLINKGIALLDDGSSSVTILVDDKETQMTFKEKDFPEPGGLIKDIQDLIVSASEREMPNIALGGAVALMGAICSNRFRLNDTWTNLYVMNLAPTGAGKSYPQSIVKRLLADPGLESILGYGAYKSGAAFVKNLQGKRERLDIIDEISSLFSYLKNGGVFQSDILEEMCKVWSESNGKFLASEYSMKEDTSTCYNPCVNVLGSSTLEGVKKEIDRSMIVKGLIPRFIIFAHSDYGTIKGSNIDKGLLSKVRAQIRDIANVKKNKNTFMEVQLNQGPVYDPINVAPTKNDAIEMLRSISLEFSNKIESESSESMKCMLTRAKEQVLKLSTIHAVGCGRRSVGVADLTWAKRVYETCLHNASLLIEEGSVENEFDRDATRVLNVIRKKGLASVGDILNSVKGIDKRKLDNVIQTLEARNAISRAERSGKKGKKKSGFVCRLDILET